MTPIERFTRNLKIPAIAAPMFLVSGPDLVQSCCEAGIAGSFPALNQRSSEGFEDWLTQIQASLSPTAAPFGVNLIVHKSNPRLAADLDLVVKHRVPFVVTSLGAVTDVVEAVHSYGGLVFHDVISRRHAEKAAQASVDGIIAVCAGAGGHGGTLSPFALLSEIRSFYSGLLILSGGMSSGRDIAAARVMGADLAYLGTRFITAHESLAGPAYKQMILASRSADILYTDAISGVSGNFLRSSIIAAGLDPDHLPPPDSIDLSNKKKAWKDIWCAGQGVAGINAEESASMICADLIDGYRQAMRAANNDLYLGR